MLKITNQAASAVLKGVTMAALLSGALATNATAEDAKIKSASFSIQPVYQGDEIVVTSSDGKKWDKIDAKALKLSATMKVDTKRPGYVSQVGILLGGCNNTGCANNPVMYYESTGTRDYHANRVFNFPGNKIPLSTTGIAVPSFGDKILKSCNGQLQSDGATKTYSFKKLLTASFSANTRKASINVPPPEVQGPGADQYPDYNGGDVTRQAQFTVKVTCKAVAFEVSSVELKTSVNPADIKQEKSCPAKGLLSVDIRTNRAGKVKFHLYRNDGAKQEVVADSKQVPNDASGKTFRVYWTKKYNFAKSVDRKYMVVLIGHKFSTPWKPMVLKCGAMNDAAGPGGLTTGPRPTHGKPNKPAIKVAPKPKRPFVPGIKVAPVRKVVCIGGKIASNQCFCPAKTKKVKVGVNAYRCIINVVKPKRVAPKAQLKRTSPAKAQRLIGKKTRSSALAR